MKKIDDNTLWTILLVTFIILAVLGVVYYQSMGVRMTPSDKPTHPPPKASKAVSELPESSSPQPQSTSMRRAVFA